MNTTVSFCDWLNVSIRYGMRGCFVKVWEVMSGLTVRLKRNNMCIKVLQRVSDQNNVKGSSYINNNKKQCSEKRVQSVYRP